MRLYLLSVIGCSFTHFICIYGTRPYISLLALENGADTLIIGVIASLYSAIQVLQALPVSKIIEKYGSRLPTIYGSLVFVFSGIGLYMSHNILLISICSLLLGLSHVLVLLSLQHSITSFEDKLVRDKYVGLFTFINSAGMFAGPILGGYSHDLWGTNMGFLSTIVIGLISLIFAFFIPDRVKQIEQKEAFKIKQLLSNQKIFTALIVCCMVWFSTDITINYFPMYGVELGLSTLVIGKILSMNGAASMFARLFLGKITTLFKRDLLLIVCLICGGIGIAFYGIFDGYYYLIIVAFFSGSFLGLLNPLTLVTVTDVSPEGERSKVLALRVMGNFIGQTISPLAFGAMAVALGLAPIFLISGMGLAMSSLLLISSIKK